MEIIETKRDVHVIGQVVGKVSVNGERAAVIIIQVVIGRDMVRPSSLQQEVRAYHLDVVQAQYRVPGAGARLHVRVDPLPTLGYR